MQKPFCLYIDSNLKSIKYMESLKKDFSQLEII